MATFSHTAHTISSSQRGHSDRVKAWSERNFLPIWGQTVKKGLILTNLHEFLSRFCLNLCFSDRALCPTWPPLSMLSMAESGQIWFLCVSVKLTQFLNPKSKWHQIKIFWKPVYPSKQPMQMFWEECIFNIFNKLFSECRFFLLSLYNY